MLPVNFKDFQKSLNKAEPPAVWPLALQSIWWDAKGNWEASHDIAQDMHNVIGSWLHAYLHRKEGDKFNAGYWYRQAGKNFPSFSLDVELRKIVEYILVSS